LWEPPERFASGTRLRINFEVQHGLDLDIAFLGGAVAIRLARFARGHHISRAAETLERLFGL